MHRFCAVVLKWGGVLFFLFFLWVDFFSRNYFFTLNLDIVVQQILAKWRTLLKETRISGYIGVCLYISFCKHFIIVSVETGIFWSTFFRLICLLQMQQNDKFWALMFECLQWNNYGKYIFKWIVHVGSSFWLRIFHVIQHSVWCLHPCLSVCVFFVCKASCLPIGPGYGYV